VANLIIFISKDGEKKNLRITISCGFFSLFEKTNPPSCKNSPQKEKNTDEKYHDGDDKSFHS
jgi:hypothetical protein